MPFSGVWLIPKLFPSHEVDWLRVWAWERVKCQVFVFTLHSFHSHSPVAPSFVKNFEKSKAWTPFPVISLLEHCNFSSENLT